MKIAILSPRHRFGDVTGDCLQAEKTAQALVQLGEDAKRFYLDFSDRDVYDSRGERVGTWQEAFLDFDIIHAIPPIPAKLIQRCPKVDAKLVCSTICWRSLSCTRVVHRNVGRITFSCVKEYIRDILSWVGIKILFTYRCYDLLLPNSEDEIRNVKRRAVTKRNVAYAAIPNAIDVLPSHLDKLSRSLRVPSGDYVLIPGYFAPRKNQQTLIKALKDEPYEVVFIGKGPLLGICEKMATERMHFLGHIEHGSDEFYSILKFARVVCLPSNCETPGIAGLEAAALGARPVVPYEGGTCQYYGWDAEYLDPLSQSSIREAVGRAWRKGRLSRVEMGRYAKGTWLECARKTLDAYNMILRK